MMTIDQACQDLVAALNTQGYNVNRPPKSGMMQVFLHPSRSGAYVPLEVIERERDGKRRLYVVVGGWGNFRASSFEVFKDWTSRVAKRLATFRSSMEG